MVQASDEVLHFFLSFSLIFFMFAVLAHFQYGTSSAEYATLKRSFLTQFQMIPAGVEGARGAALQNLCTCALIAV
eukprot:7255994-Prymnesium_polylepis.1